MAYIELSDITLAAPKQVKAVKIMIFTEGTVLAPPSIFQHFNHAVYEPIGNAVAFLQAWEAQGAEIVYLTSRKKPKHIAQIKEILRAFSFPGKYLYYRGKKQTYKDIVELVVPDILIEDDCRSIGGKWQMSITYVKPDIKSKIKSIVVREFKGIDTLPCQLAELMDFC